MSFSPPNATPSLVSSPNPLVTNAANVLSPNPIPLATPAQKAIMFLSAPPNSTPFTSLEVYILISGHINVSCTISKISLSSEAITNTVGIAIETSSA